jgi:hypothetical protein
VENFYLVCIYIVYTFAIQTLVMANIVTGLSAKKEHWASPLRFGSKTACKRKISVGKNETELFKRLSEIHPETCCKKCLDEFHRIIK